METNKLKDSYRVQRIANKLIKIWSQNNDFRLGQLLINIIRPAPANTSELFYLEDEKLEQMLDKYIKEGNLDNLWKS